MRKALFFASLAMVFLMVSCGPNPEKSRLYLDKGIDYLYTSQFDESIEFLTQAIKYDENNYEAYYYRGCTKFNRSLYDEAIVDFEKALEVKPNYSDAEFNLGMIYFLKNDFDMSCYYYKCAQLHGRPNMDDYVKSCPD